MLPFILFQSMKKQYPKQDRQEIHGWIEMHAAGTVESWMQESFRAGNLERKQDAGRRQRLADLVRLPPPPPVAAAAAPNSSHDTESDSDTTDGGGGGGGNNKGAGSGGGQGDDLDAMENQIMIHHDAG